MLQGLKNLLGGRGNTRPFNPLSKVIETYCYVDNATNEQQIEDALLRDLPEFFATVPRDETRKGKKLAIVGGGWSLKETIADIANADLIMVCGTAHDYLIEQGYDPDYAVICDSKCGVADFLKTPSRKCHYLVASNCHADVFDALAGYKVTLWHTAWGSSNDNFYVSVGIDQRIGGGCTVILNALPIAMLMGFDTFDVFGMDSCRKDKWHSYKQSLIKREEELVRIVGADGEKTFISTAEMIAQAQQFQMFVQNFGGDLTIRVHGDGLIAAMCKHAQTIAETPEVEKYNKLWTMDEYRRHSPGEYLVDCAAWTLGMKPPESIIDFGCGTGRAALKFRKLGFKVSGVDFAANCLDAGSDLPLFVGDLLSMPADLTADWGFCTDVMEHIRGEHIKDVLQAIAAHAKRGVFFSISTQPDRFGATIDEKLHMTIKPPEWWQQRLEPFWSVQQYGVTDTGTARFVCKRKTT